MTQKTRTFLRRSLLATTLTALLVLGVSADTRTAATSAMALVEQMERDGSATLTTEFPSSSWTLSERDRAQLIELGIALFRVQGLGTLDVEIVGHTDSQGDDASNDVLSHRRAEAVRLFLQQRFDLSASRLTVDGRGESSPVADNATDEGRQRNRRVEIRVGVSKQRRTAKLFAANGHTGESIVDVNSSPACGLVLTASESGIIAWDHQTLKQSTEYIPVPGLDPSKDEDSIITIRLLDDCRTVVVMAGGSDPETALSFSLDEPSRSLHRIDLGDGLYALDPVMEVAGHVVWGLHTDSDFVSGTASYRVWNARTGEFIRVDGPKDADCGVFLDGVAHFAVTDSEELRSYRGTEMIAQTRAGAPIGEHRECRFITGSGLDEPALLVVEAADDRSRIEVRSLGDLSSRWSRVSTDHQSNSISFGDLSSSPDGTRLAYISDQGLEVLDVRSGDQLLLGKPHDFGHLLGPPWLRYLDMARRMKEEGWFTEPRFSGIIRTPERIDAPVFLGSDRAAADNGIPILSDNWVMSFAAGEVRDLFQWSIKDSGSSRLLSGEGRMAIMEDGGFVVDLGTLERVSAWQRPDLTRGSTAAWAQELGAYFLPVEGAEERVRAEIRDLWTGAVLQQVAPKELAGRSIDHEQIQVHASPFEPPAMVEKIVVDTDQQRWRFVDFRRGVEPSEWFAADWICSFDDVMASDYFFAGDSHWIQFCGPRTVHVVDVTTRRVRSIQLPGDNSIRYARPKLSDDGRWLAIRRIRFSTFTDQGRELESIEEDHSVVVDVEHGTILWQRDFDSTVRSFDFAQDWGLIFSFDDLKPGLTASDFTTGATRWEIGLSVEDLQRVGPYIVAHRGAESIFIEPDTGEVKATLMASEGEWAIATPEGHYAASLGGENLLRVGIGLQAHDLSAFRDQFHRPDLVRAALHRFPGGDTAPPATASSSFGEEPPTLADLETSPPPMVTIFEPAERRITTSQDSIQVRYLAETGDDPEAEVSLLINGARVAQRGLGRRETGSLETEVRLAPGENTIVVRARNRSGTVEESVRVIREVPTASPSATTAASPTNNLWLLSIGASSYPGLPGSAQLSYAHRDAEEIAAAFERLEGRLFRQVNVRLLADGAALDPTRANIVDSLDYVAQAGQYDAVVVFLAGHAVRDPRGNYYYLPSDARLDDSGDFRKSTAIRYSQLTEALDLPAAAVFFADTCHAGSLSGVKTRSLDSDAFVRQFQGTGAAILSSSRGTELSQERDAWGHGAFTYAILKGLSGEADLIQDGRITMKELDTFISQAVPLLTGGAQHPVSYFPTGAEDFELFRVGGQP